MAVFSAKGNGHMFCQEYSAGACANSNCPNARKCPMIKKDNTVCNMTNHAPWD